MTHDSYYKTYLRSTTISREMASYTPESFKPLLNRLVQMPEYFTADDLKTALNHLFTPDAVSPVQIGAFLTAFHIHRVESRPDSLAAAAAVLRERSLKALVQEPEGDFIVDIASTGGDGYNLFNVSTTAGIVAAGADLLQALGYMFTAPTPGTTTPIPRVPFTFILAPHYHPALAFIAPYRKALPFRTMFNILAPLINPARPKGMVVGIAEREMGHTFARSLRKGGVAPWSYLLSGAITEKTPPLFGLVAIYLATVVGRSPEENAETLEKLLTSGQDIPDTLKSVLDFVLMNASALLVVAGLAENYAHGTQLALESITSGKAWAALQTFREAGLAAQKFLIQRRAYRN
ncbi:glycosyl transferase [Mycena maculata]|uniref:Glycosyl transferase n=1 Tax=Mycena maculata TaxID=230809 RepID=A0AAD7NVG9_9AGAR|nr:glycosyl transferase [Mycena maculata]